MYVTARAILAQEVLATQAPVGQLIQDPVAQPMPALEAPVTPALVGMRTQAPVDLDTRDLVVPDTMDQEVPLTPAPVGLPTQGLGGLATTVPVELVMRDPAVGAIAQPFASDSSPKLKLVCPLTVSHRQSHLSSTAPT